jgi:hypothetical protein
MTSVPDERRRGSPLPVAVAFDVEGVKRRLAAAGGGYEVVHANPPPANLTRDVDRAF